MRVLCPLHYSFTMVHLGSLFKSRRSSLYSARALVVIAFGCHELTCSQSKRQQVTKGAKSTKHGPKAARHRCSISVVQPAPTVTDEELPSGHSTWAAKQTAIAINCRAYIANVMHRKS